MRAACLSSVLAVAVSAAACPGSEGVAAADRGPDARPVIAGALVDGAWVLRADRAWDREGAGVMLPSDPLGEADYRVLDAIVAYAVTISEAGAAVAIEAEGVVSGRRVSVAPDRVSFDLTGGLFAGGRFVVWWGDATLQAEFTVYGSGVPIIGSWRGTLEPAVPASR